MKIKKSVLNKFKIIMIFTIFHLATIDNIKAITLKEHIGCLSLGPMFYFAVMSLLLDNNSCTKEYCEPKNGTKQIVGPLLILSACLTGAAYVLCITRGSGNKTT